MSFAPLCRRTRAAKKHGKRTLFTLDVPPSSCGPAGQRHALHQ